MKEELFIIGSDAIRAVSNEEAEATIKDLKEMDLYKLPFPSLSVRVPFHDIILATDKDGKPFTGEDNGTRWKDGKRDPPVGPEYGIFLTGLSLDPKIEPTIYLTFPDGITHVHPEHFHVGETPYGEFTKNVRECITDLLVVLLATRNSIKDRRENKLAKLGIGKKNLLKSFRFTTHISVPRPEDLESTIGPNAQGNHRRPHLRRGHIRRQHYGPHNELIKKIWIDPVFVNADEQFISTRTAYNLSTRLP